MYRTYEGNESDEAVVEPHVAWHAATCSRPAEELALEVRCNEEIVAGYACPKRFVVKGVNGRQSRHLALGILPHLSEAL